MRRVIGGALAVAAACALTACHSPAYPAARTAAQPAAHATIRPDPDGFVGAYELDPRMDYAPYQRFAAATGRRPGILVNYTSWFERFQSGFAAAAAAHGGVPCFQIQPYGISLRRIAAGQYDPWLRTYAAAVRRYRGPVIIGFGHEMNGPWYSWGYHHTTPAAFVAAWRHIVSTFRAEGADNVTWLWTVNRTDPSETGPVKDWWPGAAYVTWVGIDGYYVQRTDSFLSVFVPTFAQVREFTSKPVLLSETAAGPAAGKVRKIPGLFAGVRKFHLLGFVWFDVNQNGGIYHQNWRLEGNPAALATFRRVARSYSVFPRNVDTSP